MEFEFAIHLQFICNILLLNGITHTSVTHTSSFNLPLMCLSIAFIFIATSCFVCPDRRATGTGGHPLRSRYCYRNPVSKASNPPFDHVDKNPFPSLSLMHELDDHLVV